MLTFPFRESAACEKPLPITLFLDATFGFPKIETEHNVVPGRPPTKPAAFLFFENSVFGKAMAVCAQPPSAARFVLGQLPNSIANCRFLPAKNRSQGDYLLAY